MTTSFKLEEGAIEAPTISIAMGDTQIAVGADMAPNLSFTNTPQIGDRVNTVGKNIGDAAIENTAGGKTIKNANGILLAQKFDGGKISAFIVPSMGSTQSGGSDSGVSAAASAGSAYNLVYSGNLGVDGLSVKAGINDQTGKDGNEDGSAQNFGATYSFGQFSVGANRTKIEDVATSSAQDEHETTTFGLGFAANDNLSFALTVAETDGDNAGVDFAEEESAKMISVGYSLGGLGLQISFAEIEDLEGTAGSDGDAFQIRTVGKL